MRKDMKEVIVERPRRGQTARRIDKDRYRYHKDRIEDDEPATRLKMRYRHDKSQSDLLGPLRRFLQNNVGRNWDDIWAEVCEHNKDYTLGYHVRHHIMDYVEINVTIEGKKVFDEKGRELGGFYRYDGFYVHPKTNKLCVLRTRSRWRLEKPVDNKIFEINGQEYFKHDGTWYRIKTEPLIKATKDNPYPLQGDVFGVGFSDWVAYSRWRSECSYAETYGRSVRVTWKQQANHRECVKLNRLMA